MAKAIKSGTPVAKFKKEYGSVVHKWEKTYDCLAFGESEILIYCQPMDESGKMPGLTEHQKVLHRGEGYFDAILAVHTGADGSGALCHRKARTLHAAVKEKYGLSAPRWTTNLLCLTCPVCVTSQPRKKY